MIVLPKNHHENLNGTLLRIIIAQPLLDNDLTLPYVINNNVVKIFQAWLPTILDSFLFAQFH